MIENQLLSFLSLMCQTAVAKTSFTFAAKPPPKEFWFLSVATKLKLLMIRAWLLPSITG
jgi:hypothetical protein